MKITTSYVCEHCGEQFNNANSCAEHELIHDKEFKLPDWVKPGVLAVDAARGYMCRILSVSEDDDRVYYLAYDNSDGREDWKEWESIRYFCDAFREATIYRHTKDSLPIGTHVDTMAIDGYKITRIDADGTVVMRSMPTEDIELRIPLSKVHRYISEYENLWPVCAKVQIKNADGAWDDYQYNPDGFCEDDM